MTVSHRSFCSVSQVNKNTVLLSVVADGAFRSHHAQNKHRKNILTPHGVREASRVRHNSSRTACPLSPREVKIARFHLTSKVSLVRISDKLVQFLMYGLLLAFSASIVANVNSQN